MTSYGPVIFNLRHPQYFDMTLVRWPWNCLSPLISGAVHNLRRKTEQSTVCVIDVGVYAFWSNKPRKNEIARTVNRALIVRRLIQIYDTARWWDLDQRRGFRRGRMWQVRTQSWGPAILDGVGSLARRTAGSPRPAFGTPVCL